MSLRMILVILAVAGFVSFGRIALAYAQTDKHAPRGGTSGAAAQFKAAGRSASLTVYPAGLIGRPNRQVGDVVALMLERAGMKNLEIDAPEFHTPENADLDATARAFGEFVRANPPKTEYALFADFLGTRAKGFEEVRIVIANRHGESVWKDLQTQKDRDFRRMKPKEPMQCCLLVVERLRPMLALDDPTRASASEGRLSKRWAEKTGLPDNNEQAAMQERQRAFNESAASATLLVYPARAGDELSKESAVHLTKLLNDANLTKASAAPAGPQLAVKGDMNEQKVLWDMARGVRSFVQAHRPDTDYVLYADYLMGKDAAGKAKVGGVHFAVCDREGRWVIVDFQNSHDDDFKAIDPKSREDCDRLVANRMRGYCR